MIGPTIGVFPKQCDFLFGTCKDQRPVMGSASRKILNITYIIGKANSQINLQKNRSFIQKVCVA